ncbi:TPA: hypothetical protein DCE37_09255 [Candidatus Latescibacteria bacterium]|nr:hypothetical protein [Candidatus Latescibacterota bacterium]
MLGQSQNRSHLIDQALGVTLSMLEKARDVFGVAWDHLVEGGSDERISKLDQDINSGERMVRRLVIEHLTLNPEQDLPFSLTLASIIHDVERLGDYAKSIAELKEWSDSPLWTDGMGGQCREVKSRVEPLFDLAINAIRESDEEKATQLMNLHREIKASTDDITAEGLTGPGAQDVLAVLVARYLRRVSAHLSNVASSVVNPFDLIARNE